MNFFSTGESHFVCAGKSGRMKKNIAPIVAVLPQNKSAEQFWMCFHKKAVDIVGPETRLESIFTEC